MISKSVIHAFLARTDTPSVTLAAFNSSFTFYFAIASATELTVILCLSFMKSRGDLFRVWSFLALVLTVPLTLALCVAFTELGAVLFGDVFGLSEQGQSEARFSVALLTLSLPTLLLRGAAFALLMNHRRTTIIMMSTLVRLASLGLSLSLLPMVLEGATIGAAALVICMAAEATFAWLCARRHFFDLPQMRAARDTFWTYWKFAWPLAINTSAELGVIFLINVFLGRLSQPELAIAAFGVAHGLVSLLMAPMRNLTQTAQALVTKREEVTTIVVFSVQLILGFGVAAVALFLTPIRSEILEGIMGLTPELARYAQPSLEIAFLMAGVWGLTALFRGLLAKARTTTSLAVSGALRLGVAAAAGAIGTAVIDVNGALLGIAAWILAYAVETCISLWRLRRIGWFVAH